MKKKINIQISEEVIERLRNIVYWTPGLTINRFCEDALLKEIELVENGSVFDERTEDLRCGRKLKKK